MEREGTEGSVEGGKEVSTKGLEPETSCSEEDKVEYDDSSDTPSDDSDEFYEGMTNGCSECWQ